MNAPTPVTVAILADDLIWATRLSEGVRDAGGIPRPFRRTVDLEASLAAGAGAGLAIVDLTSRAYDGIEAIRAAAAAGARVLAVGPHDDLTLRREALAAGAERVLAYRKLFDDGPATLKRWMAARPATAGIADSGTGR